MTMVRHPADPVSLTFGLLFAAIGLFLLFGRTEALRLEWVVPLAAIVLGGLLIAIARSRQPAAEGRPPDD